jgi:hypothetical protein
MSVSCLYRIWRDQLRLACSRAVVRSLLVSLLAGVVSLAPDLEALTAEVPVVHNAARPRDGRQILRLTEIWRAGGADDDTFFGVICAGVRDDSGRVYLLDRQLCQVFVYAADGGLIRTLSREGEGPGEVRRPRDLLFWPDGSLAIVEGSPARIVKIDPDGIPRGIVTPQEPEPKTGGFPALSEVRYGGGNLVVCGTMRILGGPVIHIRRFLGGCDPEGRVTVLYLDRATEVKVADREYAEKDEYFVTGERWAIGLDGRVYAASARDRYAIEVFAPDGSPEMIIERPYLPWPRSAEEIEEIAAGVTMFQNGQRVEVDAKIEDHEPAIGRLWVNDSGNLWVVGSRGVREQPSGVLLTCDVFDSEGVFVREVAMSCEGRHRQDRLLYLGGDRYLLIRNYMSAMNAMFGHRVMGGPETPQDAAPEPLEIICYQAEP